MHDQEVVGSTPGLGQATIKWLLLRSVTGCEQVHNQHHPTTVRKSSTNLFGWVSDNTAWSHMAGDTC